MPKFDRSAAIIGLTLTGMSTSAAEDYVDARHGWTRLLVRPLTKRQVKLAAKVAGLTMADWMAEAVREKMERQEREGGRDG